MLNKTLEMEHNRRHSCGTKIKGARLHLRDAGSRTNTGEGNENRRIQQQEQTLPRNVPTPSDLQLRHPPYVLKN